MRVDELAAELG